MDDAPPLVLELGKLSTRPSAPRFCEGLKERFPECLRRCFSEKQHPPLLRIGDKLRLEDGVTLVIGPSGSGKSVFLSFLSGYPLAGIWPKGSARIGGSGRYIPVAQLGALYHRSMPCIYLPQRFPEMPRGTMVVKKLMLGVAEAYWPFMKMREMRSGGKCLEPVMLEQLHQNRLDHLWERDVASLSGGERQRVEFLTRLAVLKKLEAERSILILDEPTTGLDPKNAKGFLSMVASAHTGLGGKKRCAIVIATHSPNALPHAMDVPLVVIRNYENQGVKGYRTIDVTQYPNIRAFLTNRNVPEMEGDVWDIAYTLLEQDSERANVAES